MNTVNRFLNQGLIFLSAIITLGATIDHHHLYFYRNIHKARTKAATEGKLYMVTFSAKWCTPCKLMEETTFQENALIQYLDENCIPVKIDVDKIDNFTTKKAFDIHRLPATLIFNSKGQLLEKNTGYLSSAKLAALIEKYNTPDNKIKTTPPPTPYNNSATYSDGPDESYSRPKTYRDMGNVIGLKKRHKKQKRVIDKYTLQIGVYSDFDNAIQEARLLKNAISRKIRIERYDLYDKTIFKVLVGYFPDLSSANAFRNHCTSKGISTVIKKL